jgi:hypothetical protein
MLPTRALKQRSIEGFSTATLGSTTEINCFHATPHSNTTLVYQITHKNKILDRPTNPGCRILSTGARNCVKAPQNYSPRQSQKALDSPKKTTEEAVQK